jgi:hypothetical protein
VIQEPRISKASDEKAYGLHDGPTREQARQAVVASTHSEARLGAGAEVMDRDLEGEGSELYGCDRSTNTDTSNN